MILCVQLTFSGSGLTKGRPGPFGAGGVNSLAKGCNYFGN